MKRGIRKCFFSLLLWRKKSLPSLPYGAMQLARYDFGKRDLRGKIVSERVYYRQKKNLIP